MSSGNVYQWPLGGLQQVSADKSAVVENLLATEGVVHGDGIG